VEGVAARHHGVGVARRRQHVLVGRERGGHREGPQVHALAPDHHVVAVDPDGQHPGVRQAGPPAAQGGGGQQAPEGGGPAGGAGGDVPHREAVAVGGGQPQRAVPALDQDAGEDGLLRVAAGGREHLVERGAEVGGCHGQVGR
jgi:hypothetical protein